MRLACIGSREIPAGAADACREMGLELARVGYTIVTGATPGVPGQDEWASWADSAFATGAAYAASDRLVICLPWRHFPHGTVGPPPGIVVEYPDDHPEWAEAASRYWDAERAGDAVSWAAVRRAPRLRHTRNVGIILQARLLLAWPHGEAQGTRFAMDFATWRGVPVIDLSLAPWRAVLAALLAQAASPAPR